MSGRVEAVGEVEPLHQRGEHLDETGVVDVVPELVPVPAAEYPAPIRQVPAVQDPGHHRVDPGRLEYDVLAKQRVVAEVQDLAAVVQGAQQRRVPRRRGDTGRIEDALRATAGDGAPRFRFERFCGAAPGGGPTDTHQGKRLCAVDDHRTQLIDA